MIDRLAIRGVIPSRPLQFDLEMYPMGLSSMAPDPTTITIADHSSLCNPADPQEGPSCGGNTVEGFAEWMLRRDCPQDELFSRVEAIIGHRMWQVDGNRLWADARRAWYNGDMSGGLQMDEIGRIPALTGIFGQHTVRDVAPNAADRHLALRDAPVAIGIALNDGWNSPDARTGYIKPSLPNPLSGHAVIVVAAWHQRQNAFDSIQNWWRKSWGQFGFGLINSPFYDYCAIDTGKQWFPESRDWWRDSTIWNYIVASKD